MFTYKQDKLNIKNHSNSIDINIIEMQKLEFDCNRKLSSVIFRTNFGDETKIYIVTKGSIDNMRNLIKDTDITKYNNIVQNYNTNYPYLRVIAFAIKELLCYGSKIDPKQYELNLAATR